MPANSSQLQGLMLTILFFFPLEPAIVFEMGLVGVFNREVGRLAPRHTAADEREELYANSQARPISTMPRSEDSAPAS